MIKYAKILAVLILLLLLPSALAAQNVSTGFDYYRLRPAMIAKAGTV
ncbi:MAG: hypothetical protein GY863_25370, partial [bacterium]|nr:hypothetical protein [bacterium]